jgi:hypothetical protein
MLKNDKAKGPVLKMQARPHASHVLVMGAVFCHPSEDEREPTYPSGTGVALYARPGFAHPRDDELTQGAYYQAIPMKPQQLQEEAEAQLGMLRQYCLAHQLRIVKEYAWIRPGNYDPPLCAPKHIKAMFDAQKAGEFAGILLVSNRNGEVVLL